MRVATVIVVGVAFAIVAGNAAAATPAEELVDSTFGYVADEGYDLQLPAGVQTSPDEPGKRFFKFSDGGDTVFAYALGPFAFEAADGQVRSVDTDLVALPGGGWQPRSVPFAVTLPADLETGVIWQDAGTGEQVRIYPQNVNGAPGHPMAGTSDTIIYENAWNRTHMTLAVTAEGIKDHIILTEANGVPNQFKFRVERPAGARTELAADGGVRVLAASGAVLAQLPRPVARDRDLQEFRIWYEVKQQANFDVIELHYDTSPISAEGVTTTFEAPFDLDPAIYSGSIVHGVNAFRETSLNAYTVSDIVNGSLRSNLLKPPAVAPAVSTYPAGKFARWWITTPPAGSQWYSFSARIEGRVGITQKYTLYDDAGVRFTSGPAAAAGTYFTQDVSFTPAGYLNSRIEATADSTPLYDYYGTLTNAVAVYEDLVDPVLIDLRPNNTTVTSEQFTANVGMRDDQSGCASVTVTAYGPAGVIGTRSGNGCSIAPEFDVRTEGPHRLEIVLTDKSGRQTTASSTFTVNIPLNAPNPPVRDGLDPNDDAQWATRSDAFSANWAAVAGAASYQLCFAVEPCGPTERWTGFNGTSGTVGGYSFGDGQRVFACVRSISESGVRTTPTCSNGQRIDSGPPTAPAAVYDGIAMGADSSRTLSTFEAAANWPASTDAGSGVAGYESCIIPVGVDCPDDRWYERDPVESLGDLSTLETFALELGTTYRICVRAYDGVDNTSAASCSNGQAVTPSENEIEQNVLARTELGLPYAPATVRSLMMNPPRDGVIESYGFTATQQEAAYLATTFAIQDAVAKDIADLAVSEPDTYGGTYIDTDTGRTVLNLAQADPNLVAELIPDAHASCRNATVRTKGLRARANKGKKKVREFRCDSSIILRRVRYPENVLVTISDRMFDADATALRRKGIVVNRAAPNSESNRLEVVIDPVASLTPAGAEKLLNHFYTRYRRDRTGPIRVTREAGESKPTVRRARPTRDNVFRTRAFVGAGMRVSYGDGGCTSGFAFGSVRRLATAHHCINGLATNSAATESWGTGLRIGDVSGSNYLSKRLDIALTNLDPGVAVRSVVYRRYPALPANQQGPVLDFYTVQAGNAARVGRGGWVCRSASSDDTFGRLSQSCTKVRAVGVQYRLEGYGEGVFIGDEMASTPFSAGPPYNIIRGGRLTSCQGDSGGPIYRVVNYTTVQAVGINSAVDDFVPGLHPRGMPDVSCGNVAMTYAPIALGQ